MTTMVTNVTTDFLVTIFTLVTIVTNVLTDTTATVVTMVTSFNWLLRFRQHTESPTLGKFPVLFGSVTNVSEILYKYHSIRCYSQEIYNIV
jgi:hypothetical protein